MLYICTRKKQLAYGVMVTHRFLVPLFQVRVLVGEPMPQHAEGILSGSVEVIKVTPPHSTCRFGFAFQQ